MLCLNQVRPRPGDSLVLALIPLAQRTESDDIRDVHDPSIPQARDEDGSLGGALARRRASAGFGFLHAMAAAAWSGDAKNLPGRASG
jgi:hypothetical protein